MITDAILNLMLFMPNMLLDNISAVSVSIPDGVFGSISNVFGCLGFICPMSELMPILVMDVSLSMFQVVWALVIRIKSFIPTMGA